MLNVDTKLAITAIHETHSSGAVVACIQALWILIIGAQEYSQNSVWFTSTFEYHGDFFY